MKITCPNCQKNYNINETKIPAGVKTAKCKACGHPMPLKGRDPAKPTADTPVIKAQVPAKPAADTPVIKRSCLYCGQMHTLRRDKIPPGTATIKCKSCGRPLPLKMEEATATKLVHSLKKEASKPDAARTPLKTAAQPERSPDVLTLTCARCNKRYKIHSQKIPPTATSLKCRACGQRIKLFVAEVTPIQQIPTPVNLPPTLSRPRKKMRLYAMAAGILLLVMAGAFAGFKIYKDRGPAGTPEQLAASSALLRQEPFLALNLNLPLILNNIDQRVAKDKKTLKFRTTISLVKSLKLKRLEVFLYADPQERIRPVILARGSNARHLEKIFTRQEPFTKYFEHQSSGKYRLKQEALKEADEYSFPDEPYQMTLLKEGAVFAPLSVSAAIAADKSLLLNTHITGFAQSIADPQDLARVAIRVPEDLQKGWEKKIQQNPALEKNPQVAMIAGMGAGILSQLTDSLKPVETLALGFRFTGKNGRALSYAQQFRPGVDGNAVYQKLNSDDLRVLAVDGVIKALVTLFKDRRYKHKLQFADNHLALEFSWLKKDDALFLASLSKATFGQLFAQSMELTPTAGPVATEYTDDPHIFTTVDDKTLKPKIPQIVEQSLFPSNYWNFGENPQMTLDLDPVNIPNAALAELTYEVRSIQSPDGKDILRADEKKFKSTINPGSAFPGGISLPVRNGTPPESLGTARIQFSLSLPDALQIFEFKSGVEKGSQKTSGGIQVTLGRIEKDVADVAYSGGKSVRLIAYDKTGKALVSRETISASSSVSTRFQGIIDRLKVVVAASMLECPFEIDVDLNGGKELLLSRQPKIPKRIRYNHHPVSTYSDFLEPDLDDLTVAWKEAGEHKRTDNLEIQLSKGPFSGQADWEVHFFGHDQPQFLTGNAIQGARDISYRLEKGRLANVSAAFGIVQLNIRTDIKRLSFAKKEGGNPQTRNLSSGEPVTVSFNKNEVSYGAGKTQIIQVMAFDSFGKRLKQGNHSSSQGGKRSIYFWGQPASFEMDLSTKTLEKRIEFDIKQRPLDEKAYQAYKKTIDNQRRIVTTLKSVDRARRKDRSYYGDDLAGLYYLYSPKGKKPMMLFDKEIAHSDPAGQKRFGYRLKPYRGYSFTVLSGAEANGVNQEYKRRSKKGKFAWKKGTITTSALTRHPDLVAIPIDKSQPTFFLQWGQVFMKPLNGETLKYLPENYHKKGWVEAKFIEG
jgi:predicted Zn finger-like uncharacterized protein